MQWLYVILGPWKTIDYLTINSLVENISILIVFSPYQLKRGKDNS